ncbi:MAG: hypothetical protein NC453_02655 [Muribaculum sp.]|nr:hypothetical protein [Muribaculum sp.]
MKGITVTNITKSKDEIIVKFEASEDMKRFFKSPYEFRTSYSSSIVGVPDSIAVIPFICNVLPIIWLSDSTLEVNEIDKDFYESIPNFKMGYTKMYPMLKFKGNYIANSLFSNILPPHT